MPHPLCKRGENRTKSVARAAAMLSATFLRRRLLSRRTLCASAGKPIDPLRVGEVSVAELVGHLKWAKENPERNRVVLVDVRGPREITENGGSIPTAVNLPSTSYVD
jgi:hypothetical protein